MKIKYINNDDQSLLIKNAADWKKVPTLRNSLFSSAYFLLQAIKESHGHVRVNLSKKAREIPEAVAKAYDALSVCVALVDWEGIVLFANKAAKSVLGKDREDLLHLSCSDVRLVGLKATGELTH